MDLKKRDTDNFHKRYSSQTFYYDNLGNKLLNTRSAVDEFEYTRGLRRLEEVKAVKKKTICVEIYCISRSKECLNASGKYSYVFFSKCHRVRGS